MPLVWTIHVQRQNGNTLTYTYIKIIPMEQADSVCGVRLPGEKSCWKKIFLLSMVLRHFLGHGLPCLRPPIAPMSCRCTPIFFHTEQFGGTHPHFFPSIPQLSSGPSSSETFQNSFWDSAVKRSCYRPRPLFIFPQACRKEVLDPNMKSLEVWKDVRARESTLQA
jgi:hypothetical protein